MAKKVGAIVSLSVIAVLIITTIVMACINVNYGVKFENPKYVYVNYQGAGEVEAETAQVERIIEFINDASKENSLTALFNGRLNKKAEVVTGNGTLLSTEGFFVRFHYDQKQDLIEGNKKFKDGDGKTYQYTDLIFSVNNVHGEALTKVYVIPDSSNTNAYSHYYLLSADFGGLFDYLNDNFGN